MEFTEKDHRRLHDVLLSCEGYVMVSYNDCEYIRELYREFFIFRTTRPNSMSQKAGSEYATPLILSFCRMSCSAIILAGSCIAPARVRSVRLTTAGFRRTAGSPY